MDSVKHRFKERNTDIAVIPSRLTSHLQLLDVSLNKVFKAKVCHAYNQWMDEAIKEYTPTDSSIFDFGKVSGEKGRISIEEEEESNELSSESAEDKNNENDHERKYYEHYKSEERNYVNVWI
ncbi:2315_t:CDS:2 [Scutellospora calospora]|uniref:2315_t:CDS:1 n=1 Tax=Scutellospora calospora TaxID=85575 RepID=A0ACA9KVV1_9GLOM|nr:2315_t:CDS:2 [Scutellospora calospora]